MRNTATVVFFVLLALSFSTAAVCEGKSHPGITAFYVSQSTSRDSISEQWVSQFRDLISKSASYCLVDQREGAILVLSIVGLDTGAGVPVTAISIAVYFAKDQAFLAHWMYVAPKDALDSSAQRALVVLDNEVKDLKKLRLMK